MIAEISNPFFAKCCKAIDEVARDHGYSVVLCASAENAKSEREYIGLLTGRRVDGLLLAPTADGESYRELEHATDLPVVAFDRPFEGAETDAVLVTNRARAKQPYTSRDTNTGAWPSSAMTDASTPSAKGWRATGKRWWVRDSKTYTGWEPATSAPQKRPPVSCSGCRTPTAFLAGNGLITAGVLRALDHAGLRVPDDIAVVGFDDFDLMSALSPRLTAVRQPTRELGRKAAELLFAPWKARMLVPHAASFCQRNSSCEAPAAAPRLHLDNVVSIL
jgi:LacI family transcriptional regulator